MKRQLLSSLQKKSNCLMTTRRVTLSRLKFSKSLSQSLWLMSKPWEIINLVNRPLRDQFHQMNRRRTKKKIIEANKLVKAAISFPFNKLNKRSRQFTTIAVRGCNQETPGRAETTKE